MRIRTIPPIAVKDLHTAIAVRLLHHCGKEAAMWPPNKILFPIDFSERSVSAARYVRTLGCRFRPEITLMHVLVPPAYGVGSLESGPLMVEETWEERQRRAQQNVSEFAVRELAPFQVNPIVLEDDPPTAIVEKAHSQRTDLIVMATHGYGSFRRFILGSVTAKVLHDAACPVWTGAHLPAAEQASQQVPIKQVVCAVDLSSHSENVLDWAARLAASFDARREITTNTVGAKTWSAGRNTNWTGSSRVSEQRPSS
ncbi:MAG: hypothetical protein DMG58_35365 [Acidobacteria bacterium]|nr:MAG: hypothetical protein DMG58_35365 [Acidobacteriota bacterium]